MDHFHIIRTGTEFRVISVKHSKSIRKFPFSVCLSLCLLYGKLFKYFPLERLNFVPDMCMFDIGIYFETLDS